MECFPANDLHELRVYAEWEKLEAFKRWTDCLQIERVRVIGVGDTVWGLH